MNEITSLHNESIKQVTHLHTSKGRTEYHQFIAEGIRIVSTLLTTDRYPLVRLYYTDAMTGQAYALVQDSTRLTRVTPQVLAKMSTQATPSGILGVFEIPILQHLPEKELAKAGLVLANVSDPGNMGTLMRTCAALGNQSVIVVEGTDPFGPKVVQASAGTLAHLTILRCTWDQLLAQKGEQLLCALIVNGGQSPATIKELYTHNKNNILLVVGNEARGIPQEWVDQCALTMSLPMPGGVESLNAAVAGSIALYLLAAHTH